MKSWLWLLALLHTCFEATWTNGSTLTLLANYSDTDVTMKLCNDLVTASFCVTLLLGCWDM